MIPTKNKVNVSGNLVGEVVKMTLDENSTQHIMGLLTDLYEDPELAVIREYSTNARDAHLEAGNDAPIEIETPSRLAPQYTIRDFGVGLNAEDIRQVYSKYGASTKRSTNDLSGVLGLGGKSALTFTDQFTVVAVKDGIMTTVAISRSEDGGGDMNILSEDETDQPNGVEVIIPATPGSYRQDEKVSNFFRFWPDGSVKINGTLNERTKGIKINDYIEAFRSSSNYRDDEVWLDRDYIVMGHVAYPVNFEMPQKLVAYVDIGAVDFPPNRESLQNTRLTRMTKEKIVKDYKNRVRHIISSKINAAKSRHEAIQAYMDIRFLDPGAKGLMYKGEELPKHIEYPTSRNYKHLSFTRKVEKNRMRTMTVLTPNSHGRGSSGQGAHSTHTDIPLEIVAKAPFWIVNYDNKNWAAPTRRKLNAYLAKQIDKGSFPQGITADNAILCRPGQVPNIAWIDQTKILDWQIVKEFRMKPAYTVEKYAGTYDVWKKDASISTLVNAKVRFSKMNKVPVDEIDRKAPLLHAASTNVDRFNVLRKVYGDSLQIVILDSRRVAKFKRLFPESKDVNETMKDAAKKWWNGLTHQQKRMLRWEDNDEGEVAEWLKKTPIHKIKDPELREVIELARVHDKHWSKLNRMYDIFDVILDKKPLTFDGLNERYPLIVGGPSWDTDAKARDHALYYVNAVYEAEKGKG